MRIGRGPDRASGSSETGLVQLFTGDGRGKTSAALGTVLRALGHGLHVHIIQFMKGEYAYGERRTLAGLRNVDVSLFGHEHFVDPADVKPEEIAEAKRGLEKAREVINSGKYDLVVLDEVNVAVGWKLLDVEDVLDLLKGKPERVEIILTGRYADQRLVNAAHLVTEMVKIKHPFDQGILSRKGVDY